MHWFDHYATGFGGLGMILFWIVSFVLLFLAIRHVLRDKAPQRGRTALQILEERYASGEIEREDYLQRRSDLER